MSIHIAARRGDVARKILLPGDPLRAKFIAEHFLKDTVCYNEVRGMLGFTGTYRDQRVSVQGSGMGIPSISIYVNELIQAFGVNQLIRIGSCGAMQEGIKIRDLVLAQAVSTDSSMNRHVFEGFDFAPVADFEMLRRAFDASQDKGFNVHVGNVFSSDMFYRDETSAIQKMMDYGVLAVEMETTALYSLAAKYGARALAVLTVSDQLITKEQTSPGERQTTFNDMVAVALDVFSSS